MDTRQYSIRCFAELGSRFAVYAYADKPAPERTRTVSKAAADENGGFTSVLKAVEDGKKAPRQKLADKQRSSGDNEIL